MGKDENQPAMTATHDGDEPTSQGGGREPGQGGGVTDKAYPGWA